MVINTEIMRNAMIPNKMTRIDNKTMRIINKTCIEPLPVEEGPNVSILSVCSCKKRFDIVLCRSLFVRPIMQLNQVLFLPFLFLPL